MAEIRGMLWDSDNMREVFVLHMQNGEGFIHLHSNKLTSMFQWHRIQTNSQVRYLLSASFHSDIRFSMLLSTFIEYIPSFFIRRFASSNPLSSLVFYSNDT